MTKSEHLTKLLNKRVIDPITTCWIYTGHIDKDGYGLFNMYPRVVRVGRAILHLMQNFDLDSPLLALHTCKTKACFNPAHLYLGTVLNNVRDRLKDNPVTHCKNGHPLSGDNVIIDRLGYRSCITCKRVYRKSFYKLEKLLKNISKLK